MKLIDRDKFINDMFDFYIENRWNPRDIHFSLLDVRSNIDSPQFEVKAITVEWLEAWWKKHSEEYSSGIDGWYEVEGFYPNIFNKLLSDWEKRK